MSLRLGIRITGQRKAATDLKVASQRGVDAWKAAGFLVMSRALTRALPGIPVDRGELIGSAFVRRSDPVVAGFGAPHAAAVHEVPAVHRRGDWKFWQRPFSDMSRRAEPELAGLWRRAMAAGWTLRTAPGTHPAEPPPPGQTRPDGRVDRPKTGRRRRPVQRRRR